MRLALRTLLCCCMLTAMMSVVRSAAVRKKVKGRLQTNKRVAAQEFPLRPPQQGGYTQIQPSASSMLVSTRSRRSPSKTSGCYLFSCSYHDLIYRLSKMHERDKKLTTAPPHKMKSIGRRRRRNAETPTDVPAPRIPCWVCLLASDRDKSSLGRTQGGENPPRPTQQGAVDVE
ncbi:uncharacterized protein LOC144071960 [Stigmatopora argus]